MMALFCLLKKTVDGETDYMYIASSPSQIKSATDNIGTFDPNNPDIRYQKDGENGAYSLDSVEESTTLSEKKMHIPRGCKHLMMPRLYKGMHIFQIQR